MISVEAIVALITNFEKILSVAITLGATIPSGITSQTLGNVQGKYLRRTSVTVRSLSLWFTVI